MTHQLPASAQFGSVTHAEMDYVNDLTEKSGQIRVFVFYGELDDTDAFSKHFISDEEGSSQVVIPNAEDFRAFAAQADSVPEVARDSQAHYWRDLFAYIDDNNLWHSQT